MQLSKNNPNTASAIYPKITWGAWSTKGEADPEKGIISGSTSCQAALAKKVPKNFSWEEAGILCANLWALPTFSGS